MACVASRPLTLKSPKFKNAEHSRESFCPFFSYTGITDLVRGRRLIP